MRWKKIVVNCVFSFKKKLNKTLLNIADKFDYSVIKIVKLVFIFNKMVTLPVWIKPYDTVFVAK